MQFIFHKEEVEDRVKNIVIQNRNMLIIFGIDTGVLQIMFTWL